jgi:thiamine pyrophosphate-dependent acetolactate synthase large subunit-like protein
MADINRTGRFALMRQLAKDGLTEIFGNPGTSEQNLIDLFRMPEFSQFKYYLGLNEGSVVGMADAFARYRQKPVVVQLHSYAGLANGLGMMYYAKRGYTPMVVLVGESGLRYEAMDAQMAADLVTIAKPFVKNDHNGACAWRVVDGGSTLRLLRRAIKCAYTPPWGPTLLVLPMDVLEQENNEDIVATRLIDARVTPSTEALVEAAKLLSAARNPTILMGDGVAASGATAELTALAECLGATVYGANDSEVNMPASHPLYGGSTGHMFGEHSQTRLAQADAVLIAGTTVLPEVFPLLDGVFAKNAKIVQFDMNTAEIAKNFAVDVAAVGDLKLTFVSLVKHVGERLDPDRRKLAADRLEARRAEKAKLRAEAIERDAQYTGRVPLHACVFMKALAERISKDGKETLIFDEALTHSEELTRYLPPEELGSFFQTRVGMLGTGLPGTVGLKAAAPEKRVLGFAGDGGSISTIQALNTAARHKLGAKFVICNNRSYRILKYNLQNYWEKWLGQSANQPFPKEFDLEDSRLRFDLLANGHGVQSVRVETPDDIEPAIDAMLADDNEPYLIDLILSKEL